MITTTTTLNTNNLEWTLNITNHSQDILVGLQLASKDSENISDIVKTLTIYRERGHLCYEDIGQNLVIGNLYPEETAKVSFKLNSYINEEIEQTLQQNFKFLCDSSTTFTYTIE